MYSYSFAAEFLALIITVIIFAFTYEWREMILRSRRLFVMALVLNMISIALNLLTIWDQKNAADLPVVANYIINSTYYICCMILLYFYTVYLIEQLLVHVYREKVQAYLSQLIKLATIISVLLVVINYFTGWIFSFDAAGIYARGPLWIIGYLDLIFMIGVLAYCFHRYYKRIDYAGRKLLFIGIPVILMLFTYQIAYPDFLLNGTIGAFTACLCYLCFESHREEMDAVTKLGSLSAFLSKLGVAESTEKSYQVIVINLKNYGKLNTTYGFSKGNEVLYHLAFWLQNRFPDGEVYRFAPVSFGVVLPCDDSASERLTQLHRDFPREIQMEDKKYTVYPFFVEFIGEGLHKMGSEVVEALEYGIQIAKQEELEVLKFDRNMQEQMKRRKYLTTYLEESMKEQRFQMWYQPIYCPSTGMYCSAEALMRLKDADGKFISPEEFIPLAEELGMIGEISRQTMKQVMGVMQDAKKLGICQMSVNLSMQQLQVVDFLEKTKVQLKEYQVSQNSISYEVTERMMVAKDMLVKKNVKEMIREGFILLMDDFGTGYSNFSSVLDSSFQKIKIDKSLLYKSEKEGFKMIGMIVQLFHAYGKQVVVEGVETEDQANALCELGVDFIQGFYYAKPMPEKEYRAFLQANNH